MLTQFAGVIVLDGGGFPAPGATGLLFDELDVSFESPLAVTDTAGLPIPLPLSANMQGGLATLQCETTRGIAVWKPTAAGLPTQQLLSVSTVVKLAEEARAASAESSAAAIDAAAQAAQAAVPPQGAVGQVLTRLSDADGEPAYGWANPTGGGGGGAAVIILDGPDAPPPPGTLAPAILVIPDNDPTPVAFEFMTGPGNVTTASGNGGAVADLPIDIPANTTAGDLLVLVVASQSADGAAAGWQAPPGWTRYVSSMDAGALKSGRHHAVFTRYVSDPADLAGIGSKVTVGAGGLSAGQRRGGFIARAVAAHRDGVVGRSSLYPENQSTSGVRYPAFTSPVVVAGRLAYVWLNTTGGTSGASIPGWTQVARVVDQPGGAGTSSSELIAFWQAESGVDHGAIDIAISPATTGMPVGLQVAIRGA